MGTTFVDIAGEAYDELQWQCFGGDRLWQITIACEFDLCADRIYFSEYTERNDINDGSCSVYYGSKFIVKKINGPYYQTFIYAKKKEKEIPLYDRRYMGNGLFEIVEIQ